MLKKQVLDDMKVHTSEQTITMLIIPLKMQER